MYVFFFFFLDLNFFFTLTKRYILYEKDKPKDTCNLLKLLNLEEDDSAILFIVPYLSSNDLRGAMLTISRIIGLKVENFLQVLQVSRFVVKL